MQGSKVKYTKAQKRQAEHIAKGYREKGVSARVSKQRAWATVNKMSGGGKKSGSGRGKSTSELNKRKKSVARSSVASRKGSPLKRTTGSLSRGHKRSTGSTSSRSPGSRKRSTSSSKSRSQGSRKRSTSSSKSRSQGSRKRSTSSSKSRSLGGRKRSTKVSGSRGQTKKRSTTGSSTRSRKRSTLTSRTSPRKVSRTASSRGHKSVRSVSSRRRSINGFARRK